MGVQFAHTPLKCFLREYLTYRAQTRLSYGCLELGVAVELDYLLTKLLEGLEGEAILAILYDLAYTA